MCGASIHWLDVMTLTIPLSSVPVSKLPQLVSETKKDLESVGLVHSIVGHVGDGNFHALILFKTDEDLETAHAAVKRISKRAIALDGTCTGEHGVGIGKREYLVEELGEGTVELMKTIKRAIDPLGLFNPGKVRCTIFFISLEGYLIWRAYSYTLKRALQHGRRRDIGMNNFGCIPRDKLECTMGDGYFRF
jgi:hypothetical protein